MTYNVLNGMLNHTVTCFVC